MEGKEQNKCLAAALVPISGNPSRVRHGLTQREEWPSGDAIRQEVSAKMWTT